MRTFFASGSIREALKIADLTRLEVHGPAAESEKLREPLAHLKPHWFVDDEGEAVG